MFDNTYAHMLICSVLFVCEHLFTFYLCALMPKISKEKFANISFPAFSVGSSCHIFGQTITNVMSFSASQHFKLEVQRTQKEKPL